jgi:hypothetical protein
VANHQTKLLTALREVEDALSDVQQRQLQGEAQKASQVAAARGYLVARARYERGVSTYLDVTDAQRSALAADRAAVQINTQRMLAAVSVARRWAQAGSHRRSWRRWRRTAPSSAVTFTRKRPAADVPLVRSVRLQCGPHSTRGP